MKFEYTTFENLELIALTDVPEGTHYAEVSATLLYELVKKVRALGYGETNEQA